ncbi:MAG: hypothetical protein J3Q66DRAFT_358514 [Benniella sp.]|nr:MAG: hypothetical protein J3Q66DRAFT_358514 [Benniella sp.]
MVYSTRPRRALFTTSIYLLAFSISCSLKTTDAQAFTPIPAWGSVSVVLEGQSFIIQGGIGGGPTIPQTFSIDLSTSWDTSKVPYKSLQNGPNTYYHFGTLLQDKRRWFVASNGTGYEYTIAWDSWRSLGGSDLLNKSPGLSAVTDPVTGFIYIPNGYINNGTVHMARYDMTTNILSPVAMPSGVADLVSYSAVWSAKAGKMIVFGGAEGVVDTKMVFNNMYTWNSQALWTTVTPQSLVPTARRSACMVPVDDGGKIILFGGQSDYDHPVHSDLYILDTITMTWTKGADAGAVNARADPACAVSKGQLIVWGGRDASGSVIQSGLTLVYNIKKDTWQSNYSHTDNSGTADTASSPVNKGAIAIGIVGGFLAILALVVGIFFCRRRRNQKKKEGTVEPAQPDQNGPSSALNGPPTDNNHKPWQQEPWQQQQHLPQQHVAPQPHQVQMMHTPNGPVLPQTLYSSSAYQPPIIHDIQQLQDPPKIFQPQVASTTLSQPLYSTNIHSGAPYSPVSTATAYSPPPSGDLYQKPTVYYPTENRGSNLTVLKPEEYLPVSEAQTLVSHRHPQLGKMMEGYQDDDNANRRNPQALPETHPV